MVPHAPSALLGLRVALYEAVSASAPAGQVRALALREMGMAIFFSTGLNWAHFQFPVPSQTRPML